MKEIASALVKAQTEIKNASKDKQNPHLKNKYATLESVIEAVKEVANKNGIAIIQLGGRDENGDYVETNLIHTSGECISSRCYLLIGKQDMQGLGSAITYARRYSLAAVFCITQEDDDGNGAGSKAPETKTQTKKNDNVGDYVIPIGTKYRGKMLREVAQADLSSFVAWLEEDALKKNKNLEGPAVEFVTRAREFLGMGASA